jgi:uncharacterized protein (UPF0332 family)
VTTPDLETFVARDRDVVNGWREKAAEAATSARKLLERGYCDGAVDRAYFAMLYVVYLALRRRGVAVGTPRQRGLIHRAFRAELGVAEPRLADLADLFDRAEEFRWIADYGGGDVPVAAAAAITGALDDFMSPAERTFRHTHD